MKPKKNDLIWELESIIQQNGFKLKSLKALENFVKNSVKIADNYEEIETLNWQLSRRGK